MYVKGCVQKQLISFLKKHHSDDQYVFWLDMASFHYAKDTVVVYEKYRLRYISKIEKITNVPQLKPIEHFHILMDRIKTMPADNGIDYDLLS